ncbi:DUF6990 domain-containing protein [Palleronia caenipelagi]|uniref:Uncharacterized protein n=1 Tax=Palleronia caenipelagi TaxID=2489174 RepID=A0A547PIE1_9RHOB|nr:hypothetical protein [Palleronia caenipelagi]TRD13893.1 hypothetical protein FEV53_19775 [Palleronia caenipelagi]
MSFDLLVFDSRLAPTKDEEFEDWYRSLVRWDQPEDNFDPKTSSPPLQNFFDHLGKTFPSMGWSNTGAHKPIRKEGSLARLTRRLFRWKRQPESAGELPEDFDEACFADYSFSKDAIYICFAWSVSEQALHATIEAALRARVGFYYVNANNARPIRRRQDLIALKNQILSASTRKFAKADLFKLLKEDGWLVTRDADDGSRSATRVEEDKVFQLFPRISHTSDGTTIDWGESVVPLKYLDAISVINDKTYNFYPLKFQNGTRLERKNLTREVARLELDVIVAKLREEDLSVALHETANLPLSSPGNAPLRLLAAKACRGEYFDLCEMRDKMKSGNRQGFVPYIKTEHLERAVKACVQLNEDLK